MLKIPSDFQLEIVDKVFKKNLENIYISDLVEGAQTKVILHSDSIDFLHRQIFNDGKTFKEKNGFLQVRK
ncbi:MAG: hypothetical protein R2769_11180 [Saprospiraceae bacterium]